MTKQQIQVAIGSVIIIAVATLITYVNINRGMPKGNKKNINSAMTNAASPKTSPTKTPAKTSATPSKTLKTPLTYEKALEQYANRRMQFASNCSATPSYMMFKNNSSLMLDNRASAKRTITIGDKYYSINAFGFLIVTLTSKNLPATLSVHCDKQYNVAKILLQP